MYFFELSIDMTQAETTKEELMRIMSDFVGATLKGGQSIGVGEISFFAEKRIVWITGTPEKKSFAKKNESKYTRQSRRELEKICQARLEYKLIGEDPNIYPICTCAKSHAFVMLALMNDPGMLLRCCDCGKFVPLYRIPLPILFDPDYPKSIDYDYQWILWWMDAYLSCDRLQMLCGFGERWGTKQLESADSGLSKQGREIAAALERHLNTPVYYYLYNYKHLTPQADRSRKCPVCGGSWLLETQQPVDLINFKCDHCRLVSNFTFNT